MFEELLANLLSSPVLIGLVLVVAVLCFAVGRLSTAGAKKREATLKRDVLEAKASVPQLESTVRNRDQQITRLQEEIKDLTERTSGMLRDQDKQSNELRRAEREVKNLTSELNAVRGVRQADDNLMMDGFDDEVPAEPGDSAALTQLKKTEALYEKLKGALIKRDERIEELEMLLSGERSHESDSASLDAPSSEEVQALEAKTSAQAETIASLSEQVAELTREKEMLEDLANRRSKSNRALKDATAEIEAQVPALKETIAEKDKTITAREASIKKHLNEAESFRGALSERDAQIEALTADVAAQTAAAQASAAQQKALEGAMAEQQKALEGAMAEQQKTLEGTISRREERINALDTELATTLDIVKQLQADVETGRNALDGERQKLGAAQADLATRDQAEESLKNTIRDRDFRIDSLTAEKTDLDNRLEEAARNLAAAEETTAGVRQEADDNRMLTEKRVEAMDSEREVVERQAATYKREIEDLQANVAQHQQWMEKLKGTLEDREKRNRDLNERVEALSGERDALTEQLRTRHDERQSSDDARHELEREIVALKARIEQSAAEVAENTQTLSVYKSMLADKDFRIEALEQDLARVNDSESEPAQAAETDHAEAEDQPTGAEENAAADATVSDTEDAGGTDAAEHVAEEQAASELSTDEAAEDAPAMAAETTPNGDTDTVHRQAVP
ncbi:MAG: hypothetical protein AAGE43_12730 [Pseudomonadota bacterium]